MSQAIDRILEEVRNLSPEEQIRLRETLNAQPLTADSQRQSAAKNLFGKYSHAPAASAEFSARKADEIDQDKNNW